MYRLIAVCDDNDSWILTADTVGELIKELNGWISEKDFTDYPESFYTIEWDGTHILKDSETSYTWKVYNLRKEDSYV